MVWALLVVVWICNLGLGRLLWISFFESGGDWGDWVLPGGNQQLDVTPMR